jgi:anti-sigma factor RsiW
MADPRSRRTGEHNPQIIRLIADAAAMREHIDALEARILRLEAEVAAGRRSAAAPSPASMPPAATRPSKRPAAGPPPLPKVLPTIPAMPAAMSKAGGRRSIVDISEIAELVESIPPPAPGPPRPRK